MVELTLEVIGTIIALVLAGIGAVVFYVRLDSKVKQLKGHEALTANPPLTQRMAQVEATITRLETQRITQMEQSISQITPLIQKFNGAEQRIIEVASKIDIVVTYMTGLLQTDPTGHARTITFLQELYKERGK
jgi:hypothetical protein